MRDEKGERSTTGALDVGEKGDAEGWTGNVAVIGDCAVGEDEREVAICAGAIEGRCVGNETVNASFLGVGGGERGAELFGCAESCVLIVCRRFNQSIATDNQWNSLGKMVVYDLVRSTHQRKPGRVIVLIYG